MEHGNSLLSEILDQFDRKRAFLRLALSLDGDKWTIRRMEILVGDVESQWLDRKWIYKKVAFITSEIGGFRLREIFEDALREAVQVNFAEISAMLPKLRDNTYGSWRPSSAKRIFETIPWPTIDWEVSLDATSDSSWLSERYLAADGCPTFISVQEALDAFYSGGFGGGSALLPNDFGLLQIVQDHAWIHKVKVGVQSIDVHVKGKVLDDITVQLINSSNCKEKKIGSSGKVRFPRKKELDDDARIFLTSGYDCLDYRVLGFQYPHSADGRVGVEYEVIDDVESEITRLVTQGEGPKLEYKQELPRGLDSELKLMRTVAAFANGDGGEIVFGIDKDEVTIVGLGSVDESKERDRLTQMSRDFVNPSPIADARSFEYEGKRLMVLRVAPGSQRPYGRMDGGKTAVFYVRRGANTVPARPDELRKAVLE